MTAPSSSHDQLNKLRNNYQVEIQKRMTKLATDFHCKLLRLIARCEALVKKTQANDGMQTGGRRRSIGRKESQSPECDKLQQILTAVAGSTIFS